MKRRHDKQSLLLAAGLFAALPALAANQPSANQTSANQQGAIQPSAQQPGWFFGISLAHPEASLDAPAVTFSAREDNSYKLSAGYRLSQNWKAELNYLDMSKPSLTSYAFGPGVLQEGRGKGLQLVGTGTLPVTERFGLFGKLGAFHSNLESSCTTNILTCAAADRGTDLTYGVGLRYDFTKTVSVKGEWERFRRFGGRDAVGDADRNVFSVGLGFRF